MPDGTDEDLTRRALAAYFRAGGTEQPERAEVVDHEGKRYVVLSNINGPLAVYRVRTSGALKALRRWPAEVTSGIETTG